MESLKIQKTVLPDCIKLKLSGAINEDTQFSSCDLNDATRIELDLIELSSIDSCGIREWKTWLNRFGQVEFLFENCPKVFIDQLNIVHSFLPPKAKIMSFFVPYFSDENSEEKLVLFKYGYEYDDNGIIQIPKNILDSQGEAMQIDVNENRYFRFLANKKATSA